MTPAEITAPAQAPLLLSAREAAHLCGLSRTTWWSLHAAGRVPFPVHLGRRTLWRTQGPDGLTAWIGAGCPPREQFEALAAGGRRK